MNELKQISEMVIEIKKQFIFEYPALYQTHFIENIERAHSNIKDEEYKSQITEKMAEM